MVEFPKKTIHGIDSYVPWVISYPYKNPERYATNVCCPSIQALWGSFAMSFSENITDYLRYAKVLGQRSIVFAIEQQHFYTLAFLLMPKS